MKSWYKEEYSFKITVVSAGEDGQATNCRNGHEPGDTYTCEYGCPAGFCSKSMAKLFPLMEAVRSGGDLSNLLAGASKHSGEFMCPDGVVGFRLEALCNE
ncbi:putative repeat protein (TIGR04076 family) [Anaerotaenia torta]|uniref:TIGR04076 family protein n=1 Tax=Anaerotaenia torta TaxID=433293 RepID=UPI003D1ACC69